VPVPDLETAGLPLLWHWIYLLDRPAPSELGPDGAIVRETIRAGRRRMWAGGRVRTAGPLRCGQPATRHSQVLRVEEKAGRSGPLTFVTVGNQIWQQGRVVVDEQQDIVYRQATASPRPTTPQPTTPQPMTPRPAGAGERAIEVSPVLLFRFSALTYNAHRIHYDRDYARDVEGYPGLLTHGPLQALAMAEAARAAGYPDGDGGLDFRYRLESPLFDHQGLIVKAVRRDDALVTSVRDSYGRQTASGTLVRAGLEHQRQL
jgi:3-methylfumaryl-CoA hydratase